MIWEIKKPVEKGFGGLGKQRYFSGVLLFKQPDSDSPSEITIGLQCKFTNFF